MPARHQEFFVLQSLRAFTRLILPEFRAGFVIILAFSIAVGVLEMVGVASILPLMAALMSGAEPAAGGTVARALAFVGLGPKLPPVHIAASITIGLFVLQAIAGLLLNMLTVRFSARLAYRLSERFALDCFRQPFAFFLQHSPTELAHRTTTEIGQIASSCIQQFCMILARLVQLALVVLLLALIEPLASLFILGGISALYVAIYLYTSRRMERAGTSVVRATDVAMQSAGEMYGMAREVLLSRDPGFLVQRVLGALGVFYRADALSKIVPTIPKYALEVLAVVLLFSVPIYRSWMGEDPRADLPVMAAFAFAGLRMLPLAQQVYVSLTNLRFHQPMAERLGAMLHAPRAVTTPLRRAYPEMLELDAVGHTYQAERGAVLSDITLSLRRGEKIAIVGPSGSGKSTLADILLGLLAPALGRVTLDDATVAGEALSWAHGVVGYVPQTPLILSGTLAANIAFGEELDLARGALVAERAGLSEVIAAQPKGLLAVVGEDVASLSGGERQRVAIARALYRAPKLFVLDEPASALDPPRARLIFELLTQGTGDATVVAITHDMAHLALFDRIVFLEAGRIVAEGQLETLLAASPAFRNYYGRVQSG
jgi:ATP-binding cassette, subfamily B, bacterial PglK